MRPPPLTPTPPPRALALTSLTKFYDSPRCVSGKAKNPAARRQNHGMQIYARYTNLFTSRQDEKGHSRKILAWAGWSRYKRKRVIMEGVVTVLECIYRYIYVYMQTYIYMYCYCYCL